MKIKLVLATAICAASIAGSHAGSIRVYNNDSRDHEVKLKCSGSSKEMDIRRSATATYTFHSSNRECDITGGSVDWPNDTMKDGTKWKISGGKAKPM